MAIGVLLAMASGAWSVEAPAGASQEPNTIVLTLPAEANVTLAINDAQGKRVRNLVGDMPLKAGRHVIEWDGRDDAGQLLPAGQYKWVGLTRGPMHAVYRGAFQHGNPPWLYGKTGGWISDHSSAVAAVAVGDKVVLGATEAEWGHGLIASDLDGRKLWGVRWLAKRAWCGGDSLAAVGERVFISSYLNENAVWEVDVATGENWLVVEKDDVPAEAGTAQGLRVIGARATPQGGEVYVANFNDPEPKTFVFAPKARGEKLSHVRTLAVKPWSLAFGSDGRCVAAMDKSLEILDVQTGKTTPLVSEGLSAPYAVALDAQGRIFVSDQGDTGEHKRLKDGQLGWRYARLGGKAAHQIKVFDASGKRLAAIGAEGGRKPGKLDDGAFYMPGGIAVDAKGRLWVTEMTMSPKRVTVWEIPADLGAQTPRLARQFVGPAMYGGGAAMVDPSQPWRIMDTNFGVVFDVDLTSGEYKAVEMPWRAYNPYKEHGYRPDLPFMGQPGVVIELDGRKFSALQGGYIHGPEARWSPHRYNATGPVVIGEYRGDRFQPLAAIGNIRMWMRNRELRARREDQWLPPAILDAARKLPDWPKYAQAMNMAPDAADVPHVEHKRGSKDWIVHPWPKDISGFIWVDANGDAKLQADEITLHPQEDCDPITLDGNLNAYVTVDAWLGQAKGLYKYTRDGFNSVGAPVYKVENLRRITQEPLNVSHVGADGSMLTFGALYSPEGKAIWTYPVNPKGIKELGADKAEVTRPGRIHRVNAVKGVVKGPGDLGDVYMLGSVDGMTYFLTRDDGLFIATIFRPSAYADGWDSIPEAKVGMNLEGYTLQEECFNNHFARAAASGKGFEKDHYYLLGLGRSAVVELTGLESVKRLPGGSIALVEGIGRFGKQEKHDPTGEAPRLASNKARGAIKAARRVPGADPFAGPSAKWAASDVWFAWDDKNLLIKWQVKGDKTPFINADPDFTQLFSTGDVCDIQLASPKLGKMRLVMAMHKDQPAVVRMLYEGADTPHVVTYRSGVAETHVASVEKLEIKPGVRRMKDMYVLQASLPWSVLGVEPREGLELAMELGTFASDTTGTNTLAREYWSSGVSGMVADVPTEARLTENWGVLTLSAAPQEPGAATRPAASAPANKGAGEAPKAQPAPGGKGKALSASDKAQFKESVRMGDAEVWTAWDGRGLHLKVQVKKDASPMANDGADLATLVSTGDAVVLEFQSPSDGRCLLAFTRQGQDKVVVRYQLEGEGTDASAAKWSAQKLDLSYSLRTIPDGYVIQTTVPMKTLGLEGQSGAKLPANFIVVRGPADEAGKASRVDWVSGNKARPVDPFTPSPTLGEITLK